MKELREKEDLLEDLKCEFEEVDLRREELERTLAVQEEERKKVIQDLGDWVKVCSINPTYCWPTTKYRRGTHQPSVP